jgi:hypothetical protein
MLLSAVGCASSYSAAADPCALLTRSEIATAIHGAVDLGKHVSPDGKPSPQFCAYGVTTPVRTVFVHLGHGHPPRDGSGPARNATATRGTVFVTVSGRYPDTNFPTVAAQLAQKAIARATNP